MAKLGLRDRIQVVVYAYETGLIPPRAAGYAGARPRSPRPCAGSTLTRLCAAITR
jgi:hypothetical protein